MFAQSLCTYRRDESTILVVNGDVVRFLGLADVIFNPSNPKPKQSAQGVLTGVAGALLHRIELIEGEKRALEIMGPVENLAPGEVAVGGVVKETCIAHITVPINMRVGDKEELRVMRIVAERPTELIVCNLDNKNIQHFVKAHRCPPNSQFKIGDEVKVIFNNGKPRAFAHADFEVPSEDEYMRLIANTVVKALEFAKSHKVLAMPFPGAGGFGFKEDDVVKVVTRTVFKHVPQGTAVLLVHPNLQTCEVAAETLEGLIV